MGVTFGFPSLCAILIAVACAQFEKMKATILDIRQEHFTFHYGREDEQDHTIANCDLQAKLTERI